MSRAILALPLLVLVVIVGFAVRGLTIDQAVQPSALISRPVPSMDLGALEGFGEPLSAEDLVGQVSLLNVFGSWCAYCTVEHPFLMEVAAEGDVPIYGLNWRDQPGAGEAWLRRYGNPYAKVGADPGSVAVMDLGVTGAPETFIVDQNGIIRHRHVGPVTPDNWATDFAPRIAALRELRPDEDPIPPGSAGVILD